MSLHFLILSIFIFFMLLFFFPRVLAVVMLLYYSIQEKPHERSTANYKLEQLRESETRVIRI